MDFSEFKESDWIQFYGVIASLVVSVVSIIIAVLTLKQNSKMIEESTRPYVSIYGETTFFQEQHYYLVIKNFGQSGAKITKFLSDTDLSKFSYQESKKPFQNIENTFLAPNQSLRCALDPRKMYRNKIDFLKFHIEYECGRKKYRDDYEVNFVIERGLTQVRSSTDGKELKIISYTLQDFVEHLL